LHIDENSLTPIFAQVAAGIQEDILAGRILEGEQVPSTNEFASIYGINPATARKGFNILVDSGIIYKKRGIGMFVAEGAREKIASKAKEELLSTGIAELIKKAAELGISRQELIDKIRDAEV